MEQHQPSDGVPTHELPKVAAKYRLQAFSASCERARSDLLARAEAYESRVVELILEAA